ncbi:MAG: Uncharacterised protein [Marine Group II euryarchaeote MED-G33]|nr:MAG: Uncharacterised protein [Marine Group II euryarchaeote MED-G33]
MSTTLPPVQMGASLLSHMPKNCPYTGLQMDLNSSMSTTTRMLYWDWIGVLMGDGLSRVEMTTASVFTTPQMGL